MQVVFSAKDNLGLCDAQRMQGASARGNTMKVNPRVVGRFQELVERGERLFNPLSDLGMIPNQPIYIGPDFQASNQWGMNCLNLIGRIFGKESDQYQHFQNAYIDIGYYSNLQRALAILKAAKDDYEHDYLFDTRTMIEAEVFDDFLEQASHLLATGYDGPAAVTAGCVLEDGLRKLCARHGIQLPANPKLDVMNAELVKHGIYDKLTQKNVTWLADIRNKAAHGEWHQFTKPDVEQMITQTRLFMERYFS